MTTRERIQADLANVPEENLDELHGLIHAYMASKRTPPGGIMSKLRGIQIEAPADFAANLDVYVSGEKRVGDGLH